MLCIVDMHSSRDTMLKEKFWIEEDEPIAEEILLSSLNNNTEEEEEQQQQGDGAEILDTQKSYLLQKNDANTSDRKQVRWMLCQVNTNNIIIIFAYY